MIVDANLEPIKFLNPVSITISVKDIPPNEDKEAQFADQPANRELNKQIREKQHSMALQQTNHYKKWSNPETKTLEPNYGKFFKDDKPIATPEEVKETKSDLAEIPEDAPVESTEAPVISEPTEQ
jgi:hypothetical protein